MRTTNVRGISKHLVGAIVVAAVLLLAAVPAARGQGTFKLTYEALGEQDGVLAGQGNQWVPALPEKPESCKGVPNSPAKNAAFLQAEIGGGPVLMIAEPDPMRLFVDTDRDNDLSDEKPLTDAKDGLFSGVVVKSVEKGSPEVRVNVRVYCGVAQILFRGGEASQEKIVSAASVSPYGAYKTEATLGGDKYRIALVDATFNGRVNDAYAPNKTYDQFAVDLNRDGQFDQWSETMPLPGTTMAGDAFYSVAVAADGSTITFEKVTPPLGTLECTSPAAMFTALLAPSDAEGPDGGVFRLQPGVGKWQLPVGKYQVSSFELFTRDKDGNEWRAGLAEAKGIETFEIRKGETTTLKAGPPFTLKEDVAEKDGVVSIGVNVFGQGGERYFSYPRTTAQGGGAATLKILDEKGAELASGPMEYG